MSVRLRRRALLVMVTGGALSLPLVGFARPETLPQRSAVFEEIGTSILLSLSLPALVRRSDAEALASIDSGFDTTLEFQLKVWKHGSRKLVASRRIVVKVRRDPWKKNYLVRTRGTSGWIKRSFARRRDAIEAAVTLDRVKICSASRLTRGGQGGPFYFVEILAMRNPLKRNQGRAQGPETRHGQGRDTGWFRRLVEVLAGERARAEQTVHVRTNPFFLLPR